MDEKEEMVVGNLDAGGSSVALQLITWKRDKIMSHYDFRKQIVLAWLGDKEDDKAESNPEEPFNQKC